MKVAIMTRLFAKRDVDVDSAHNLVVSGQFKKVVSGQGFSSQCFNLGFF
jgi:hypothetical protein